ncbi:MAG TPA: ABC transporter substrate-binding protein [Terriglobales bacterium]|nr:ABC transporter substrate-binding protein [Terriglobales bacterium]
MIERRRLIAAMLAAPLALPQVGAQTAAAIPRIGFLTPGTGAVNEDPFWTELRRLGYVPGENIAIEYRSSRGDFERLPALAAELVRLKVNVIVAFVTQASLAAKQATATIPIVMVGVVDPVRAGLVSNLAHPGGNITGTSGVGANVVDKQLELVRTLLPHAAQVSVLWNPSNRVFARQLLDEAMLAAPKLRLQLRAVEARTPDELDGAFAAISEHKPDALLVLADPMLGSQAQRIADLALEHRLVGISMVRGYADAGLVATYGQSYGDSYRRAAAYVDKILKGAKPGDLPVEQATTLELVVNLRTAKALGLTIPQSLRLRADELIQ